MVVKTAESGQGVQSPPPHKYQTKAIFAKADQSQNPVNGSIINHFVLVQRAVNGAVPAVALRMCFKISKLSETVKRTVCLMFYLIDNACFHCFESLHAFRLEYYNECTTNFNKIQQTIHRLCHRSLRKPRAHGPRAPATRVHQSDTSPDNIKGCFFFKFRFS